MNSETNLRNKRKKPYSSDQLGTLNEIKKVLCTAIRNNQSRLRGRSPVARAEEDLGTNLSRLSEIYCHQYDKLTINQLLHYLILLNPNFKIQLLFNYYE